MRKIEISLFFAFVIATYLRIVHFPGGLILGSIALTTLALFYFFLGFAYFNDIKLRAIFYRSSYRNLNWLEILSALLLGVSIANIIEGFLYQNMFKNGSGFRYIWGLVFMILSLVLLIVKKFHFKSKMKKIGYHIFFSFLAFTGILLPTESFIDFYHQGTPEYSKALKEVYRSPSNIEAQKRLREVKQEKDIEEYQRRSQKN